MALGLVRACQLLPKGMAHGGVFCQGAVIDDQQGRRFPLLRGAMSASLSPLSPLRDRPVWRFLAGVTTAVVIAGGVSALAAESASGEPSDGE